MSVSEESPYEDLQLVESVEFFTLFFTGSLRHHTGTVFREVLMTALVDSAPGAVALEPGLDSAAAGAGAGGPGSGRGLLARTHQHRRGHQQLQHRAL